MEKYKTKFIDVSNNYLIGIEHFNMFDYEAKQMPKEKFKKEEGNGHHIEEKRMPQPERVCDSEHGARWLDELRQSVNGVHSVCNVT